VAKEKDYPEVEVSYEKLAATSLPSLLNWINTPESMQTVEQKRCWNPLTVDITDHSKGVSLGSTNLTETNLLDMNLPFRTTKRGKDCVYIARHHKMTSRLTKTISDSHTLLDKVKGCFNTTN